MKIKSFLAGVLVALIVLPAVITVPWMVKNAAALNTGLADQFEPFAQAYNLIQKKYVDAEKTEPKKLVHGAIKGMTDTLDPFSQFMDPASYQELMTETRGSFGGIGIEIGEREKRLLVIAPIEGTPAERAGLKAGDLIQKIDGVSTDGLSLMDAVSKIRGEIGTAVVLTILREGEERARDVSLTRAAIKIQSVKPGILFDGDVGYVRVSQFMETTEDDLRRALSDLRRQGMKRIVLDLRNDPGGLLVQSWRVSSLFIPEGQLVVYTQGRLEEQNQKFFSSGASEYREMPMAVLINRGSASASEIVAGALQDGQRAVLVGQRTFGKGSVQTIEKLADGSALRLTTARYYTPKGRMIHEKGIEPDIKIDDKGRSVIEALGKDNVKPDSVTAAAEVKTLLRDATLQTYEKEIYYIFAKEWTKRNAQRAEAMKRSGDYRELKMIPEMKRSFLKLCLDKKVKISKEDYRADQELIEREILRSIVNQAGGEEHARKYALQHDKVLLRAIEELKKNR